MKAPQIPLIISKASYNKNILPYYDETQEMSRNQILKNGQLRPMHLKDTKDKQSRIQESSVKKGKHLRKRRYGQSTKDRMAVKISNWPPSLVLTLITRWQTAAREKLRTM